MHYADCHLLNHFGSSPFSYFIRRTAPTNADKSLLRRSVGSVVKLSDLIVRRAQIARRSLFYLSLVEHRHVHDRVGVVAYRNSVSARSGQQQTLAAKLTEQLIFAYREVLALLGAELSHLRVCCVGKQIVVIAVLQADAVLLSRLRFETARFDIAPTAVEETPQLLTEPCCRVLVDDDLRVERTALQKDCVEVFRVLYDFLLGELFMVVKCFYYKMRLTTPSGIGCL